MTGKLKLLDLFSGIGGFSLGLERTGGFETVAFCEIDKFCQHILAERWPEVHCYDDIKTLTGSRLASDGITVEAICGGFPCQDISSAGKRAGIKGVRSGLWGEMARLTSELRPQFLIVENVTALLGRGMDVVLGDLASIGYDAEWFDISAEDVGAPHSRSRVWIIAYPMLARLEGCRIAERIETKISVARNANDDSNASFIAGLYGVGKRGLSSVIDASDNRPSWGGQQWPETQPMLCRVGDGIPHRVDRTSALGNAVVPQIPEIIGNAILEHIRMIEAMT